MIMLAMFDYKIIVGDCYFHTTRERSVVHAMFSVASICVCSICM